MYEYKKERKRVFEEANQEAFLKMRDRVKELLAKSGAFQVEKALGAGDSWLQLAFLDRLLELREIREVPQSNVAGQHRIFVKGK